MLFHARLENLGFTVLALYCDGLSANRRFFGCMMQDQKHQCTELLTPMLMTVRNVAFSFCLKSKTYANGLLIGLTSFRLIVAFLTAYQLLSHLEGITVKLQSSSLDFIEAHDMIKEVKGVYAELRRTIDLHFHKKL